MAVLFIVLTIVMLACAFMAFRAKQLIVSALWLAGCSAILSLIMYLLGAFAVAVIELSVGAGLVTVLFVFAISIAGDETIEIKSIIPRPIALIIALVSIVLLGFMTISSLVSLPVTTETASFSDMLWQQRGLDMLVQSGLLFAAVLGLLGLLGEAKVPVKEKKTVSAKEPQATQSAVKPVAATPEVKA
ncbi:MAG TPA: NADH-quinone oxidoreductase subunit J [Anaerolineae bacterium]|nr:NADH-quinone oxidoreductase subunit J [Anaerolineae bacterium]